MWKHKIQLSFEVVSLPNLAFRRAYRVVAIPQTTVISPQGIVLWNHSGLLRDGAAYRDLLSRVGRCGGGGL